MTDVPQETAERLALRARRSMDSGDISTAIEQQNQAVELRKQELGRLEKESPTLTELARMSPERVRGVPSVVRPAICPESWISKSDA